MRSATLSITLVSALLSACAVPQTSELRSQPANAQLQVNASIECLYNKGVERVSSYSGMSEPRFTWYMDATRTSAWFRQPLTLVELRSLSPGITEVRRSQTSSASAFGQGNDLLAFLQSNPCSGV
jgi:hypothetical protein